LNKISFEQFISCFRKQFQFQVGRGGRRVSKYYTSQTWERGLKNDKWAIMVFIHTGSAYGFNDLQMHAELNISRSLYNFLKEETINVLQSSYHDKLLHKNVICKIGLVKNYIRYTYGICPCELI
jgi:hypothetical protein